MQNSRGFSLVEVMLTSALLLLLTFGLVTIVNNMNKQVKATEDMSQIGNTLSSIRQMMEKKDVCKFNLDNNLIGSRSFNATTPSTASFSFSRLQIPGSTDSTIIAGSPLPGMPNVTSGSLTVSDIKVLNINGTTASYIAKLRFNFSRSVAGVDLAPIQRDLSIVLNAGVSGTTATVTDCNSTGISAAEIDSIEEAACVNLGGTWNPTATPKCDLPDNVVTLNTSNCQTMFGSNYVWDATLNTCKPNSRTIASSLAMDCTQLGADWYLDTQTQKCKMSASSLCTQTGFTWNGTNCVPSITPQQACTLMGNGYTWTGSQCVPIIGGATTCGSLGPGWSWDGSKCVPPSSGSSCSYDYSYYSGGPRGTLAHSEVIAINCEFLPEGYDSGLKTFQCWGGTMKAVGHNCRRASGGGGP